MRPTKRQIERMIEELEMEINPEQQASDLREAVAARLSLNEEQLPMPIKTMWYKDTRPEFPDSAFEEIPVDVHGAEIHATPLMWDIVRYETDEGEYRDTDELWAEIQDAYFDLDGEDLHFDPTWRLAVSNAVAKDEEERTL